MDLMPFILVPYRGDEIVVYLRAVPEAGDHVLLGSGEEYVVTSRTFTSGGAWETRLNVRAATTVPPR